MTMTQPRRTTNSGVPTPGGPTGPPSSQAESANLGDVLERVLDKGIVIAGDIQVNLLDIELLTIKLRLIVASVDTARRMGINWWESDPGLRADSYPGRKEALSERVERLERELSDAQRQPESARGELEVARGRETEWRVTENERVQEE
jgi:hypothetical protein